MSSEKAIYIPSKKHSMRIVVFASGSGGNLNAAINLSKKYPHLLQVCLVITDRFGIPALKIAEKNNIPALVFNFEKQCGKWIEQINDDKKIKRYYDCSIKFHNNILKQIKITEKKQGFNFDLAVLCYHRWINGKLFDYFNSKMINQHSGDLNVMEENKEFQRKYIGHQPVAKALCSGEKKTRTTTIMVKVGHDNGEILCQGPWVNYSGPKKISKTAILKHRLKQKKQSDWPALRFALKEIALGNFKFSIKKNTPMVLDSFSTKISHFHITALIYLN